MADYKSVLEAIYPPKAYFGRLMRVSAALKRPKLNVKLNARHWLRNFRIFARLAIEITVRRPRMAIPFWRYVVTTLAINPRAIEPTMMSVMMYMHLEHFTGFVVEEMGRRIAELDAGIDPTLPRLPATTTQTIASAKAA